ncbi:MAG TPA: BatA domain-containing protein [Gemmataceae bacterium]|nr:BatA domain-containing protein [Gemmataceae bacterium]
MLTFLSPLFLVGLLAAAIPLIIHLSRSRRTKKMRFSTTRFFTDQFLRSYRMSRLKELLLLACRMALCGLFAAALARPLFLPRGQSFLVGGGRSVVLVIDNSASMGYTEDGVTMLERAKTAAREVVDGLRPGDDTVSIVLAGRRADGPEVVFPQPTADITDVLGAINTIQVLPLGTDLRGAVERAEAIALAAPAPSKEVYVLSDLQDSGWEMGDEPTAASGSSDVLFFFVSVRPKSVSNLAVTAVQYQAARPMVGVPFAIRPYIAGQGDEGRSCDVRLYVDGQKVGERHLEKLANGRWAVPRFYHTFTTGGWHSGYVEVSDDALPLDNRRHFAFEVLDSVKVLAVNGAPSQVPRLDELFFLRTALTAGEEQSPIQLDVIGPPALGGTDLGKYPLVILANVESLTPDAVEKLEQYADGGGSVLFFLGDKVNAAFYNQALAAATRIHGGLLPGRLTDVQGNAGAGKPDESFATVSSVDYDHPALAAFGDSRFATLGGVTFKALWGVEPGDAAVLMKASNGSPLLLEKAFGKGRVMLFSSTCDRDWTNFPVRPAFLPWTHRLVSYLAQEPMGRQGFFATGDAIPLPVSVAERTPQLLVKKPDGTIGNATATDDPARPLVFSDTTQPGVYALMSAEKKEASQLFAVNLDGYESDLTYLDDVFAEREGSEARPAKVEAGLKELLPGRPLVTYVEDPARITEASQSARRGFKLWDIFLGIVLVIALVEPWLANRISLRHYAKPREEPEGPRAATLGLEPSLKTEGVPS